MDDRGARTLAAERSPEFGAGRSALAPSAVLAVPNTALAFDSLRSRPTDHTRSPLESLAPPGVASSLPAQGSPSSVLGGSGGTPGAASPMQLSVLLMTAWRSLVRQSVSHPAIIALAHLAPPG
jgi:hypothetical protein